MIFIAEKETFIARVLIKKVNDAGVTCEYVPCNVNAINAKIGTVPLVTFFMDENDIPDSEVLHFLTDTLDEKNAQMIIIGEQGDIDNVVKNIPGDLLYKTFSRPVDNAVYASTIVEYFRKVESGEFKKTILVVDDDPQFLGLVREWLKGTYKVAMANSGMQAIKWLGKNKADLILLDHEMPVTSGPRVLEMLRSEPDTKDIPVMFLTGKGDKESVMQVVALRPEGYFLKNITKQELLEKLQEYFILHKKPGE
ncbi:MAG: response regulator [Lachnospiraceae bacterium]|nr:response regulator [Lachnospiraceae bacterium]